MKEAFEKIKEMLKEMTFKAELHEFGWKGQTVNNLLCLGDAVDIVNEVAEEYGTDINVGSNNQLKPCPFCGCSTNKVGIRNQHDKGYKVVCGNCGASGTYVTIKDWHDNKMIAQGQAIKAWNQRKE